MPMGIYPRTKEHNRKIGLAQQFNLDRDKIKKLYIEENKTLRDISRIFLVSQTPIKRILKEMNIRIKTTGEQNKGKLKAWNKGLTKETDERMRKISEVQIIKINKICKNPNCNKEFVANGTYKDRKFCSQDCYNTFQKGQHKSPQTELKKGEQHPCFNNWSSLEPYDSNFNDDFKRSILNRDNNICMLCGINQEELIESLVVHHINYDKKLSISQNCVSLCRGCHSMTNHNREHWTKFFQSLLAERYGYKYSEMGEIVLEMLR